MPINRVSFIPTLHEICVAQDAGNQRTGSSNPDKAAEKQHWLSKAYQLLLCGPMTFQVTFVQRSEASVLGSLPYSKQQATRPDHNIH